MESPDTEKLLARVDADVARGEAWRGRRRLRSYVSQFKGEPRFAVKLGEMLLEIGELPEARRFLCDGCSMEEAHQPHIIRYLERWKVTGEFRRALRTALLHADAGAPLPAAVTAAIESRGLRTENEVKRAVKTNERRQERRAQDPMLRNVLDMALVALFLLIFGLGVISLFWIVAGWFS